MKLDGINLIEQALHIKTRDVDGERSRLTYSHISLVYTCIQECVLKYALDNIWHTFQGYST